MNKKNKIIYFFLTSLLFYGSFFMYNNHIFASGPDHIVISEIQIGGEKANDEFIELYNPTNSKVDLTGWDLKKKTSGTEYNNILTNIKCSEYSKCSIPAYGYFLIIPKIKCGAENEICYYKGSIIVDNRYTTIKSLANNNTLLLYNASDEVVDKVGWGDASDFEGTAVNMTNYEKGESIARKSNNNIIQDTNNNSTDFVIQTIPNPQNSSSFMKQASSPNNNTTTDTNTSSSPASTNTTNDTTITNTNNSTQENKSTSVSISPNIIITEFLPNPKGNDAKNEFIEIYNNGDKEVDLSGWTLEDKIGKIKKFIIPEKEKISSGEYKAFYRNQTKIILNNSGDGVVLRDNKNNIVDEISVGNSIKEGQSYALEKNGNWSLTIMPTPGKENIIKIEGKIVDKKKDVFVQKNNSSDENNKANNIKQTCSKNLQNCEDNTNDNSTRKANANANYNFSDRIIISEIYPNPSGKDNTKENYEWIELYNDSDEDVNLRGWQIDDILQKGSRAYLIKEDKIIKARGFAVFKNVQTKIRLNNFGDEVNLLWPDKTLIDKVKYEKADEGLSYNLSSNGKWFWSSKITPGKENKIETAQSKNNSDDNITTEVKNIKKKSEEVIKKENENDFIETDIKDIKHFTKNSRVKVSGIVSTPPKIFADDVFYLLGSGIQVYSYEAKIPKIELGDKIEIIGRVSEVGGEKRILLDNSNDIKILSHNNLVESQLFSTGDINKSVEGYLVMVEGKISKIKDDVFYLDDGSGAVKIYIKPQTEIKKSEVKKGNWMVITGEVSRTSLGYRILPRFQNDIKLSRVSGTSTLISTSQLSSKIKDTKNSKNLLIILFSAITILILVGWKKVRSRK